MVGWDLCGWFPLDESLHACIDYYWHYPNVEILETTTSNIMNKLRKLFCRYNSSKTIVKYNGAQFAHNTTFDALIKNWY